MGVKYKRSRVWVDPAFQGRLLLRVAGYVLVFSTCLFHIAFAFDLLATFATRGISGSVGQLYLEFLHRQTPLLFAFVLVTPVLLYDVLKFSHRLAGPLFRCRRMMQDMVEGKPVVEFTPRQNDLLGDLFEAFNALIRAWKARGEAALADRPAPGGNGVAKAEQIKEKLEV